MEKGRLLITGAGGYVGARLAAALKKNDNAVCRDNAGHAERAGNEGHAGARGCGSILCADRSSFDYQSVESIRRYFEGKEIRAVIHLAAVCEAQDPGAYYLVNICGLRNLLTVCLEYGVRQFIFISGNNVYSADSAEAHTEEELCRPDERNLYGISKYMGELLIQDMLQQSSMKYCILRISDIYGSGQRYGNLMKAMIQRAGNGEALQVYGQGRRIRDYIFIQDVVDGIIFSWKRDLNGIYNLSTGIGTSVCELAGLVDRICGGYNGIDYLPCENEDKSCVILSSEKLRKEGFRAKYSLEQGIRQMLGRTKE